MHQFLSHDHVGGTRDRQQLGRPLENGKNQDLKVSHSGKKGWGYAYGILSKSVAVIGSSDIREPEGFKER
jgi:hypothetical protein